MTLVPKTISFYHNTPLTESNLFKSSTGSPLFRQMCNSDIHLNIDYNTEIVPELIRDKNDPITSTRIIMIDTDTKIARIAFDSDGLSSTLDVDTLVEQFKDVGIESLFTYLVLKFYDHIGATTRPMTGELITIENVEIDLLAALIAIGFNDPLDILLYLSTDKGIQYCTVMAVKPRLKN